MERFAHMEDGRTLRVLGIERGFDPEDKKMRYSVSIPGIGYRGDAKHLAEHIEKAMQAAVVHITDGILVGWRGTL